MARVTARIARHAALRPAHYNHRVTCFVEAEPSGGAQTESLTPRGGASAGRSRCDRRFTMHEDEHDPFAVFDKSTGSGAVRDPYPTFAKLREESPVYAG